MRRGVAPERGVAAPRRALSDPSDSPSSDPTRRCSFVWGGGGVWKRQAEALAAAERVRREREGEEAAQIREEEEKKQKAELDRKQAREAARRQREAMQQEIDMDKQRTVASSFIDDMGAGATGFDRMT